MINIPAGTKYTIRNRRNETYHQISQFLEEGFHAMGLSIYAINRSSTGFIAFATSLSDSSQCPSCQTVCHHVHKYYTRTLESLEIFGMPVTVKVHARYYYCDFPECERRTFSEPLGIAERYARKSREVEQRILDASLNLSSRKASILLENQNIHASISKCTRQAKSLGESNPVCESIHVGIDDFAFKRGHVYMCMVSDHDSGKPIAVFNCRHGEELDKWLLANPQIETVTRDGSHDYARAIQRNLPEATQVSDKFHLIKNLLEGVTASFQKMLYQTNEKLSYPLPSIEEAYSYILRDIYGMGEKKHRERVNRFLQVKEMIAKGYTWMEIVESIGKSPTYIRELIHGKSLSMHLDIRQRKALKYASEVANIVSGGNLTVSTIVKKMEGRLDSYLISRMMRTLTAVYTEKRKSVREHNKALKTSKAKKKVPVRAIRYLVLKGETNDEKLADIIKSVPAIRNVVNLCVAFRKMLKEGLGEISLEQWIKMAKISANRHLVSFAYNLEADKVAIQAAIHSKYNNARLEGAVNRVKSIKRTMYNRAGIKLLRAKIIYGL